MLFRSGENNCKQFGDVFHPKDDCCVQPPASIRAQNESVSQIPNEPKPGQRCAGRKLTLRYTAYKMASVTQQVADSATPSKTAPRVLFGEV